MRRQLTRALLLSLALSFSGAAGAAGKKKPQDTPAPSAPLKGRVTLELSEIPRAAIEVPTVTSDSERVYDFAPGFRERLTNDLTNLGSAIVMHTQPVGGAQKLSLARATGEDPVWDGIPVPAARLRIFVETMTFQTGAGGDRMSYGFDERMQGEFSAPDLTRANEFPMKETDIAPNWFDRAFDYEGDWNTGSRAGLDLGQGFKLDALFAFLAIKYAAYRADLTLRLELDSEYSGVRRTRQLQVKGRGFYFDISGGYANWSAQIALARRDALGKAVGRAFDGSLEAIRGFLGEIPKTGLIHAVDPAGVVYLNTGLNAAIPAGTTYVSQQDSRASIVVTRSVASGALARLNTGAAGLLQPGTVWVEGQPTSGPPSLAKLSAQAAPADASAIELPDQNLPKIEFQGVSQSKWKAFWKSIVGLPLLPYRIWRYFHYDQGLRDLDELEQKQELSWDLAREGGRSSETLTEAQEKLSGDEVATGRLSALAAARPGEVVVAVLDSGVDYNHRAVHDRIWVNPAPQVDSRQRSDLYGWDFISGDHRPYDDHFHGTTIAGRLVEVAPQARVMPLKVFNPWGVTSSAAMESALRYAVDHGAQIILCAWATPVRSRALENGIRYAAEHGVIVVAAAGDRGDDLRTLPEYPAAFSQTHPNVITVAALARTGDILRRFGVFSNYGPSRIQVGVMAEDLNLPSPRGNWRLASGTGPAAAAVAGWLAGEGASAWLELPAAERAQAAREAVRAASRPVPALEPFISEGRALEL